MAVESDPGTIAGLITLGARGAMALFKIWAESRKQDAQRDADFREDYVEDARSAREVMRENGRLQGRIEALEKEVEHQTARGDRYKSVAVRLEELLERVRPAIETSGVYDLSEPISEELEAADEALSMEVGDGG